MVIYQGDVPELELLVDASHNFLDTQRPNILHIEGHYILSFQKVPEIDIVILHYCHFSHERNILKIGMKYSTGYNSKNCNNNNYCSRIFRKRIVELETVFSPFVTIDVSESNIGQILHVHSEI